MAQKSRRAVLISYDRDLLYFFSDFLPLERKHHIRCPLKVTDISFPAHTTFAMLQANELLFHFVTADGADLIAFSHALHLLFFLLIFYSICHQLSSLFSEQQRDAAQAMRSAAYLYRFRYVQIDNIRSRVISLAAL